MRHSLVQIIAASAVGAIIAVSSAPTFATTAKECATEYTMQKDALEPFPINPYHSQRP